MPKTAKYYFKVTKNRELRSSRSSNITSFLTRHYIKEPVQNCSLMFRLQSTRASEVTQVDLQLCCQLFLLRVLPRLYPARFLKQYPASPSYRSILFMRRLPGLWKRKYDNTGVKTAMICSCQIHIIWKIKIMPQIRMHLVNKKHSQSEWLKGLKNRG